MAPSEKILSVRYPEALDTDVNTSFGCKIYQTEQNQTGTNLNGIFYHPAITLVNPRNSECATQQQSTKEWQ